MMLLISEYHILVIKVINLRSDTQHYHLIAEKKKTLIQLSTWSGFNLSFYISYRISWSFLFIPSKPLPLLIFYRRTDTDAVNSLTLYLHAIYTTTRSCSRDANKHTTLTLKALKPTHNRPPWNHWWRAWAPGSGAAGRRRNDWISAAGSDVAGRNLEEKTGEEREVQAWPMVIKVCEGSWTWQLSVTLLLCLRQWNQLFQPHISLL